MHLVKSCKLVLAVASWPGETRFRHTKPAKPFVSCVSSGSNSKVRVPVCTPIAPTAAINRNCATAQAAPVSQALTYETRTGTCPSRK